MKAKKKQEEGGRACGLSLILIKGGERRKRKWEPERQLSGISGCLARAKS